MGVSGSKNHNIPSKFDAFTVDQMLRDFVEDKDAQNPLRIPIADPFVRHFIHHSALRMNLVSASEGGHAYLPNEEHVKGGPTREVVIWKNRENDIQSIRNTLIGFVKAPTGERLELPPMSPELRYVSRLLAREYGLVGISEGLADKRHCILWKAPDRCQIGAKLDQFAAIASKTDKLELPPMDPTMRRFTAQLATDLGLYAVSEGFGKDRRLVVYYAKPAAARELTSSYLRQLFAENTASGEVPARVSAHDIRGVLQKIGLPEVFGRAAISLAETSPDNCVPLDALVQLVDAREKELRKVFNAFDRNHDGQVRVDDVEKALQALDIAPTSSDYIFVDALAEQARRKGDSGMNFVDFRNLCTFLDLKDLSALGSEQMAASSLGFQSKAPPADPSYYYALSSATAGGASNAFSRTCVAPFERLRLQMAVDGTKYKGMYDCLRTIWLEEGVRGLWRGNVLNVIRIAPQGAIAFCTKDLMKTMVPEQLRYTSAGLALASMASGIICMSSVYPLDFVRGRMTTCPGAYKSWQSALGQIYRQGGIRALFEGVQYSNAWAAVYYGVQFFSYDTIKNGYVKYRKAKGQDATTNASTGVMFGAVSGTFCVSTAYPFESVRRKLQVQGVGGRPMLYNGWFDCVKKTVAQQGVRGLYKGLGANMIKTPPSIAITFGTYEWLMSSVFKAQKK